MRRHPLLLLAAAFIPGLCAGAWLPLPPAWLFTILALGVALAIVCTRFPAFRLGCLLVGVIACAALRWLLFENSLIDPALRTLPTYTRIVAAGSVAGPPDTTASGMTRFALRLQAVRIDSAWQPARGKLLVYSRLAVDSVRMGQHLLACGNLVWPLAERNPGEFNFTRYLHQRAIQAVLRVRRDGWIDATDPTPAPVFAASAWMAGFREHLQTQIERYAGPETAPILKALIIGLRDGIDDETTEHFARSGVIHVLAVSGLHVGFVMGICYGVLWLLRLPRQRLIALVLAAVWFYAWLTGAKPPVVRASVMATLFLVGQLRDRPTTPANFLAAAALLILLVRPVELFNAGFQLSFSAVAGILFLHPVIDQTFQRSAWLRRCCAYRLPRWVIGMLGVTLAAQLGTLPVSVFHFGRFSIAGFVANLFVVPMIFLTVASAFAALAIAIVAPAVASVLAAVPNLLIHGILRLTAWIGAAPLASIDNWHPPITLLCLYIVVLVLLFFGWQRRVFVLAIGAGLAIGNVHVWSAVLNRPHEAEITVLDVGQGDAIFIRFPGGKTLLIDAGHATPDFDAGEQRIVPFLRQAGVRKLDMVIISHPHLDHFGGLPAILKALPIRSVVVTDSTDDNPLFQELLATLRDAGVVLRQVRRGDVIDDFAPARLLVLSPSPIDDPLLRTANNASVAVQLRVGDTAFLFPGDAETAAEMAMLPFSELLQSDVLKAGHHGSATSSTTPFVAAVAPRWSIVSAGAFNRFGHPSPLVTARLDSLGSDTLRTDLHGATVFRSDGRTVRRVR